MRIEAAEWKAGILMLKTSDPEAVRMSVELEPGDYEITPIKKRRSKDANAYCWVLCQAISEKVFGMTKEDVYLRSIQRVGIYKDFTLTLDEAKTFEAAWQRLGIGWPTETVDFDADGNRFVVRAYYGSSTYNTKQMSRLIDDLVQDAKALDIETMSEREQSLLLEEWHGSQ